MEGTIYSLIPAVIMLILVLVTRKVLLSLGTGIIVGALFIHDFNIVESLKEVWLVFYGIFVVDGSPNWGNILLLVFLFLLGIMTAFLQASGGSRAFGEWMMKRVKTRAGAQIMTGILGIIIFIDDYFSSLSIGQIARPLTDRHRVSRAKLAYFIDSMAAPVTVLSPISSWGAYIIGILGGLFAANGITSMQPIEAFIMMIPHNFYAIIAVLLVFIVAIFNFNIGPMRTHEDRAVQTGELLDPKQNNVPGDLSDVFEPNKNGRVYHLIVPIIMLFVATIVAMLVTGIQATEGKASIITAFANTNVNLSLFIGGFMAVLTSAIFHFSQKQPRENVGKIFVEGLKTMLPAINILLLAWMVGSVISTLKIGAYLAEIVNNASINVSFIPIIFFAVTLLMSLATGTSWGTFGMMLPIGVEIMMHTDSQLLLPALAAILSGSVFGDHCSPISDTTILSATGAGSNHMDHVLTQLPYAIMSAIIAAIGFLVIGFTNQVVLALFVSVVLLAAAVFVQHLLIAKKTSVN
ncbi:Na+/H+ antiporter NhaC family protein [Oceanobacillus chungangensis]|uniref:Sodium:proton antiporter n=1 Tax=Oceanobacillus chungangensis TaxID=1229152 RepID=A0A3D8PXS0_9BACI|nr:Na+/H+ antiporter NhaC family protein [Oceanobacillus chungangensis]RDW20946.1 sodium:proton antiporter [Oceanobacillus chungangensis]